MSKKTLSQIQAERTVEELRRAAEACRRNREWTKAKRYDAQADAKEALQAEG